MTSRERILVIDDEAYIREFVSQVLSEKYHVFSAKNGPDGVELAKQVKPSVIVLDILMAGQDGIEICKRLRKDPETANVRILMLSALNEPETRIEAFSAGADDYISKPFRPEELLIRVDAKVRRFNNSGPQAKSPLLELIFEDVSIDLQNLRVSIDDQPLDIGSVEFRILSALIRKHGELVHRKTIENLIWSGEPPSDRALDPHITSLRKKLAKSQVELKTVYGSGFCLTSKKTAL